MEDASCPYCGSDQKKRLGEGIFLREYFRSFERNQIGDKDVIVRCDGCGQYYGETQAYGEVKNFLLPGRPLRVQSLPIALGHGTL